MLYLVEQMRDNRAQLIDSTLGLQGVHKERRQLAQKNFEDIQAAMHYKISALYTEFAKTIERLQNNENNGNIVRSCLVELKKHVDRFIEALQTII